MKASPELLADVTWEIDNVLRGNPTARDDYRAGRFPRSDATKDLDMRFRWDLYWAIPSWIRQPLQDRMDGEGLTNIHCDTMLRAAVMPL